MKLSKGLQTSIQSYKHNEMVHRVWKNTTIIECFDNMIVTAHTKTRVIEDTGRTWFTREPALCYFYDDLWFNVIVMLKKDGIYYYCNMASPYLYDGEAIKYIDYDLDVKVFPDGTYKILDQNEFEYHKKLMNYPSEIQTIIEDELEKLIKRIESKEAPFNEEYINRYLNISKESTKKRKYKKWLNKFFIFH